MQEFTVFDMVIIGITILLGLKGLFRGLIKEVFGLVGIVGGIFISSRMALDIGNMIAPVLALENVATIKLIGFILGIVGFWIIVYILGMILSKIFQASGLGVFDRIFGFIFGASKVFLIFSIIAYGLYQLQSFKSLMNEKVGNSIVFPFLIDAGGLIVKLDTKDLVNLTNTEEKVQKDPEEPVLEENKKFSEQVKDTVNEIKKTTQDSTNAVIDTVKQSVEKKIQEEVNEVIEPSSTKSTEENK